MAALPRIGLLVGSSRYGGNAAGLATWLSSVLEGRLNSPAKTIDIVTVYPTKEPHPLGPVADGSRLPAQVPDSSSYSSPIIQQWSAFVSSCSAFAVISPEYNGGYPGELKNSLDHLYTEWAGKPVLLITYGSRGGFRCSAQLRGVLTSMKMTVLDDPVGIKMPKDFVAGSERVVPGEGFPEFLSPYEELVGKAADDLKDRLLKASESG
ncbi:hypothetical protein EW026_g943 [Hermanssonia centrifuga]|uniref:NADPH-dependent FMN reductase-like domain-containing protein n=1 Tax=Hermanssonia centrifuga TaxID=98765 RepID=A0A4S4KTK0_9APHY|nr:hypothetical protein EW026_g943 [Hermanssonia centrifuga]